MKVLLTGATGFIGNAVLKELILQVNVDVRTYGRRLPNISSLNNVEHVSGELGDVVKLRIALAEIDVVIHCAALAHRPSRHDEFNCINTEATLKLARQAVDAGVQRFIFISSIGVNGCRSQDKAFRHDDVVNPWEDYSVSKYVAEQALQHLASETGLEVVIIRPPLVYGPNAPGNFGKLLNAINRGLVLPLGSINNRRSFVALDNLVDLILICSRHPLASNQIFLVCDDHDISTTEFLKEMALVAGKPSRLLPIPVSWLRLLGKLTGKEAVIERLCDNLQVDITFTKERLDWQPKVSVREGLRRCFYKGG